MSKKISTTINRALALLVFAIACAIPAQAGPMMFEDEPARKWVSPDGSDDNPCTRTQPCRTFNAALAQVAVGGEVVARDSGGYAPFRITKGVKVIAPPGVHASIDAPPGSTAISVNVSANSVVLRNLSLNSQGAGNGIICAGSNLRMAVENCVINGFAESGLAYIGNGGFYVNDTVIRNCDTGILVRGAPYSGRAHIGRTRLERCGDYGIRVVNAEAMIHDSVVTDAVVYGIILEHEEGTSYPAVIVMENCVVSNSNYGLAAFRAGLDPSKATMYVSNSTISDSGIGGSGLIKSRGNNTVLSDGAFSSTFQAK